MKVETKRYLLAGCAIAGALAASQVVAAETATAEQTGEPNAASEGSEQSNEIVVTAQKRSERLKDVPAAVTAITSAVLQETAATKLDDYVARIPGLVVSQGGGANASIQLSIRGITTGTGGNPTVGIYIDDSPFGASSGYGGYTVPDLDPQDLARVEVLRGPQGTLYGAGSLGGLLKYVTADPDPTRFFGRVQVDGSTIDGGGDGYSIRGAVNIPISEELALRVSGYNRRDPGYIDNVLTGETNINNVRYYGGRASLGWTNGDWKVRLSALYQRSKGSAPIVDYDSFTFQPFFGDLKQSRARDTTSVKQAIGAYSLHIEGDLGFATLTSASAYNQQNMGFNLDYSPFLAAQLAPLFEIPTLGFRAYSPVDIEKYTQELRLTSHSTNILSWQLGLFYTRESQKAASDVIPIDSLTGATIDGLPQILNAALDAKFREVAVFGNVTYRFSDAFDVTAGLRYSENKQRSLASYAGLPYPGGVNVNVRSNDNAVTFLINPRLRLNENTMIYARVASGFRPGGPNSVSANLPQSFAPDKVTDYELGLKSDLLDRTLSLELSAFWIDWNNIQIQRVDPLGSYLDNGPSAVSKGFEASISLRPVSGLDLYGNVAHARARLTEDLPAGSAIGFAGDRLPLTPRWSASAGIGYSVPLSGALKVNFGADWRHVGAKPGAFPNPGQVRYRLPSYDSVDLRVGLSDDRFTLMLFAKNIGDARGQSADVNLGMGTTSVSVIQPRTFGLSLAANF